MWSKKSTNNPEISVIIANFNGAKYLKNCIESILDSSECQFEIIVVDDASTDESLSILEQFSSHILLIKNRQNLGTSISRNLAAVKAHAQILLFLDVDTTIFPYTLGQIKQYLNSQPKVGAIQAALLNPHSQNLETAGHYLSILGYPYEIGQNQDLNKFEQPFPILGGRTAGLAVKKLVFKQIHGFDENYLIYAEDTDLCWRIWLSGFKVFFLPQAQIVHYQKSSLNKVTYKRIYYEGCKNNLRNLLKNMDLFRLLFVLPLFCISSMLIILKLVLLGHFAYAIMIIKAFAWNISKFTKTLKVRNVPLVLPNDILFGKLNFGQLIAKSWRYFIHD